MTEVRKTRRIGRKRWGALVRFLTSQMETAQSERVRMTAALRLADILALREQREQLEIRRELRLAGRADEAPNDTQDALVSEETPESRAERFLAGLRQQETVSE